MVEMQGGSAWQGFVSGMRMGAITGAISSGVPAAINALVKPKLFIPREVDTRTVDLSPEIKTELPDPPQIQQKAKSYKYRAIAERFEGRTINDPNNLPPATLDRGRFNSEGSTNSVYIGIDKAGKVRYVGITERDPNVRFDEHINSGTGRSLLRYQVVPGTTNLSRISARVWEQTLINQFGLQKNGGLLLNKINSIAPKYWGQHGIK